jgi:hypothetical protein
METLLEIVKSNPDQINAMVAACALFVSLLFIVLTFIALILQRRHNFKSLTPIGVSLLATMRGVCS